ncbi:hypothetical protein L6472_06150 [Prevotella sp. E13-17]|uniref:hypothetical protein n=1 Tax=Prevotella sp. E13-17 TaxID=2913616 RepID=UPI001EDABE64|nr:hypothetical protein [Prevotella sp. E13-17]UKK52160.1 hypothetical protein L6472_06150 [Prevotella sp. E13-17]
MAKKNIKFTIIKELVINTVKNMTFKNGQVAKGADTANTVSAYHQQAGDEDYHERLLDRGYYTNLESLKASLSDYMVGDGNLTENPLIDDTEADGVNTIILSVNERFNDGYVKTLARMASRYIEDSMLSDWYGDSDATKANYFTALAAKDLDSIRRTFSKTPPKAPSYLYPTKITLRYPIIPERDGHPGMASSSDETVIGPQQLFFNPWCITRGETSEISYTLEGEGGKMPIDDILVRCDNTYCSVELDDNGNWLLRGMAAGGTLVTLFSRHNDNVFAKFAVQITED